MGVITFTMNEDNSKINTSTSIKNVQNSTLSANDIVDIMNTCGCGFEIGSLEFIRLHVESQEEENDRLAAEQHLAEQEAQADYYANMSEESHPTMCGVCI